jgi:hypothetical protein
MLHFPYPIRPVFPDSLEDSHHRGLFAVARLRIFRLVRRIHPTKSGGGGELNAARN